MSLICTVTAVKNLKYHTRKLFITNPLLQDYQVCVLTSTFMILIAADLFKYWIIRWTREFCFKMIFTKQFQEINLLLQTNTGVLTSTVLVQDCLCNFFMFPKLKISFKMSIRAMWWQDGQDFLKKGVMHHFHIKKTWSIMMVITQDFYWPPDDISIQQRWCEKWLGKLKALENKVYHSTNSLTSNSTWASL